MNGMTSNVCCSRHEGGAPDTFGLLPARRVLALVGVGALMWAASGHRQCPPLPHEHSPRTIIDAELIPVVYPQTSPTPQKKSRPASELKSPRWCSRRPPQPLRKTFLNDRCHPIPCGS
eukprot:gene15017-biopygen11190